VDRPLAIRGLSGPRVLLLVNGLRFSVLRSYGEHPPLLDADDIRRVEIIRGPASVLYGSDAVAGVVNLITGGADRAGLSRRPVSGRIGSQFHSANAQWNASAELRREWKKAAFTMHAARRTAEDLRSPRGVLENTGFRGWTAQSETDVRLPPDAASPYSAWRTG